MWDEASTARAEAHASTATARAKALTTRPAIPSASGTTATARRKGVLDMVACVG
jgi:hypothetical protein